MGAGARRIPPAEDTELTFAVYNGDKLLHKGVIRIALTLQGENFGRYTARLDSATLQMLSNTKENGGILTTKD